MNISCGNKYKIVVMLLIFYLLPPDEFKIYNMTENRTWTFKKKALLFSIQFCLNENMVEFTVRERPLYTAGRGRFWCDTVICFNLTAYKSKTFVRMHFVRLILCKTETVRFKELRNIFINELKWWYFDITICIPNVGIYLLNFTKTLWFHESKMYFFMNCLDN